MKRVKQKENKMKQFNDEYLDDVTYIKDIRHMQMGPWHQYDILLDAQSYGWDYILDSADYMAAADLKHINEVQTGDLKVQTVDITDPYHEHNNKFSEESVKCLEELAKRALFDNDEAAYRLSSAFAVYFADMPSVMKWVKVTHELADDHLKMKRRLKKR